MEPEGSSPYSQVPAICPYPEPTPSSLHPLPLSEDPSLEKLYYFFNRLAPELFFFLILAHSVYKMWIKQEPNMLELWSKLHFEEKETESIYHV